MTRALILAFLAAAGTKSAIPRTADGHPDLQGTWDNATVTPLERPKEFADKPYFTDAEAADFVAHGLDRFIAARGEMELKVNGEINGIWSGPARVGPSLRTSIVIDPPDGRLPPLTPETQARIQARMAERRAHPFETYVDGVVEEVFVSRGQPLQPGQSIRFRFLAGGEFRYQQVLLRFGMVPNLSIGRRYWVVLQRDESGGWSTGAPLFDISGSRIPPITYATSCDDSQRSSRVVDHERTSLVIDLIRKVAKETGTYGAVVNWVNWESSIPLQIQSEPQG